MGIPQAFADLVIVVPFNDLDAVRRAFDGAPGADRRDVRGAGHDELRRDHARRRATSQGLIELCHANGAYLAFDEVKTGATLAYGGAVEVFGVTPDIVCLAKAIGGGLPCGAIGATRELYRPVIEDEYDMAGTFNGNPLTMAASRAALTEVLVGGVYDEFNRIDQVMKDGPVGRDREVRPARLRERRRREGLGDLLGQARARVP